MLKRRLPELAIAACFIAVLCGARVLAQAAAEHDQPVTEQVQPATATSPADTQAAPAAPAGEDNFDFFSDKPVQSSEVVELPPEKSKWITTGGPAALIAFFFLLIGFFWWMVPFKQHTLDINLHDAPTAIQRGIAMASVLFGIAFCFGASEIWYQLRLHGSAEAYFAQMSLGKLIAFTHAHLFGFTTSFFII
ncbi:MAG TPA: hypothetical protein VM074_12765, partial [Solimonas sp.]|nr:hypothetical protein [Solimonas sp.]